MKLIINQEDSFSDLIFINAIDWIDFKTKEVKGVRINVVSLMEYDKFSVKIRGKTVKDYDSIQGKSLVSFDDLEVQFFVINNKKITSFIASDLREKTKLVKPKISTV